MSRGANPPGMSPGTAILPRGSVPTSRHLSHPPPPSQRLLQWVQVWGPHGVSDLEPPRRGLGTCRGASVLPREAAPSSRHLLLLPPSFPEGFCSWVASPPGGGHGVVHHLRPGAPHLGPWSPGSRVHKTSFCSWSRQACAHSPLKPRLEVCWLALGSLREWGAPGAQGAQQQGRSPGCP